MVSPPQGGAASISRVSIVESKQVFVEGIEEVRVFNSLVIHLQLSGIQIQPYSGKDRLRQFLKILTSQDDFDIIRSLAVVADADFDIGAARDRVHGALQDARLPVPTAPLAKKSQGELSVSYLLLPHEGEGMLEDVCLESVKANPVMNCVEQFMQCVRDERTDWPKQNMEAKARVHAYLSSLDPPDLRLGEAAAGGHWNFDDSAFNPLKQLLQEL